MAGLPTPQSIVSILTTVQLLCIRLRSLHRSRLGTARKRTLPIHFRLCRNLLGRSLLGRHLGKTPYTG